MSQVEFPQVVIICLEFTLIETGIVMHITQNNPVVVMEKVSNEL